MSYVFFYLIMVCIELKEKKYQKQCIYSIFK
nr:MAG TPA: hypothetical protein [Caudoviricetes sp.]